MFSTTTRISFSSFSQVRSLASLACDVYPATNTSISTPSNLIVIHGYLGSKMNWKTMLKRPEYSSMNTYCIDLPNHGNSPHIEPASYDTMIDELLRFMDEQSIETTDILGHSLGGKLAMGFTRQYPERLSRLIVADICPIQYPEDSVQHPVDILNEMNLSLIDSRKAADDMLALNISEPLLRGFLLQNLLFDNKTKTASWKCNLKELVSRRGDYNDFPFQAQPKINTPTLFIRGTESEFTQSHFLPSIHEWFENPQIEAINAAGHWPHISHPKEFASIVEQFLKR